MGSRLSGYARRMVIETLTLRVWHIRQNIIIAKNNGEKVWNGYRKEIKALKEAVKYLREEK